VARVLPFRALRYAPRFAAEMGSVVAPPYDVIGENDRIRYQQTHPKNVVRLILPGETGRAEDGTFYSGAAALLNCWREEGTLLEDPAPAFYPYRQSYRGPDGSRAARLGFLGALSLENQAPGAGALPHEMTLEAPRRDRTRLIAACRANLSPIFLLHPDTQGKVGPALAAAASGEQLFRFTDDQGVLHELWRMDNPELVRRVGEGMEADWTLIADGHHRYESAAAVMEQLPGEEGARLVLAFFCSLQDRGFRIFPIHRLVRSMGRLERGGLRRLLQERLGWEALPQGTGIERLLTRLKGAGEGTFAALLPEGPPLLLRPPSAGKGDTGRGAPGEPDTQVLQEEILTGVLGITPEAVSAGAVGYTPDPGEAFRQVESGEADAAFLLNPLRAEAVVHAARAGVRLPQKSTYFYPKVFTGLAIRPF